MYRNGESRRLCRAPIGCYSTIFQIKQSVIFELGIDDNTEMRLYGYRGNELINDSDITSLPNNYIIFAVLEGNINNNK